MQGGVDDSSLEANGPQSMSDDKIEAHTENASSLNPVANPNAYPASIVVHHTIVYHHQSYCVFSTRHHHTLHEAI